MKQLLHNVRTGAVSVEEVPRPIVGDDAVLVGNRCSLISAGTERAALQLGQKSLLGKARQRPDLVEKVLDKLKRDGLSATLQSVRRQLDRDVPLGYSACGDVIQLGCKVSGLQAGQSVACAGAGFACHAELNSVPRLLVAGLPEGVSYAAGAYATVGAIALQGVRNAEVQVGESVVVLGLGLVGQLAVQILKAAGCQVLGLDVSSARVQLAIEQGADAAFLVGEATSESAIHTLTRGRGADAVLITAATASNQPVETAARVARQRGRVVMVGVTGMDLPRRDYYYKELTFVVSRSYGPGRYDPAYEQHGHDYPVGYVRWTENRNLEAFLDLVASGRVNPEVFTTHRFPIDEAVEAYELIFSERESYLGVLLEYPRNEHEGSLRDERPIVLRAARPKSGVGSLPDGSSRRAARVGVSFVGAGSFASGVLIPLLKKRPDVELRGVMTARGLTAVSTGKRFGFQYCTAQLAQLLEDPQTDCLFIATRHAEHAALVSEALRAGKHVFVEKPLAISLEQLREVHRSLEESSGQLLVGFNRRFAPMAQRMRVLFDSAGPLHVLYRCNAGRLAADHWLNDPAQGGRIVGEACHFVDFCSFFTGARPLTVTCRQTGAGGVASDADNCLLTLEMDDGSLCQISYVTEGASRADKERIEVHGGGQSAVLTDFRRLESHSARPSRGPRWRFRQDKGHGQQLAEWVDCLRRGTAAPIAVESLFDTTLATLAALHSRRLQRPIQLDEMRQQMLDAYGTA